MSRLILHIGLPKTGSSAIQAFLAANADRLQCEAGLQWLDGLRGPNHTELAIACSDRPSALAKAYGVRSEQDRVALRRRVRTRLIQAARDGDLMISSEHLAALLRSPAEIACLADLLHGVADEIAVIGVLRRGDHWLPSAYAEAVRGGRRVAPGPGFVDRRRHLLDHRLLLRRWSDGFGSGAVRLVPFLENDKADPVAVPARFLSAAGVDAHLTGWQHSDRLTRAGLGALGVEVLRRVGPDLGIDRLTGREREQVVRLLAELFPGPRVALSPAAARRLAEHGWIRTGIGSTPQAFGDQWPAWRDEPAAPVHRPPKPSARDLSTATAALRRAGLVAGQGVGVRPRLRRVVRVVRSGTALVPALRHRIGP